jgi:hypothetical protein
MSSDLHPFLGTFVYENSRSKVAIKEVSGLIVLNLQVFAQRKLVLFLVVIQQMGHKFCSTTLHVG